MNLRSGGRWGGGEAYVQLFSCIISDVSIANLTGILMVSQKLTS